jgi:hypothetical protein
LAINWLLLFPPTMKWSLLVVLVIYRSDSAQTGSYLIVSSKSELWRMPIRISDYVGLYVIQIRYGDRSVLDWKWAYITCSYMRNIISINTWLKIQICYMIILPVVYNYILLNACKKKYIFHKPMWVHKDGPIN